MLSKWDVLTPPSEDKHKEILISKVRIASSLYANFLFSSDYTLKNPDTLTKYKDAAAISQKVLEAVTALCVAGEKIVVICEKGDKLLEEEIEKVYRGKKILKGTFSYLMRASSD